MGRCLMATDLTGCAAQGGMSKWLFSHADIDLTDHNDLFRIISVSVEQVERTGEPLRNAGQVVKAGIPLCRHGELIPPLNLRSLRGGCGARRSVMPQVTKRDHQPTGGSPR